MELKDIKKILADFYEGTTSKEDETALYDYFLTAENLSKELEVEQKLFLKLYEESSEIEVPVHLESKLNSLVDRLADEETSRREQADVNLPQRRTLNWKWVAGVAASLLILVSSLIIMTPKEGEQSNLAQEQDLQELVDTYTDPKEAYVVTQNALLLASAKLNKAFQQVETVQENVAKLNKQ